jgi:hypothetical protein
MDRLKRHRYDGFSAVPANKSKSLADAGLLAAGAPMRWP